jgi:hypothetical protein
VTDQEFTSPAKADAAQNALFEQFGNERLNMAGVTTTIPTDLTGVSPVANFLSALSFGTLIGAVLRNVSIAAAAALLLPLFAFGVITLNTNAGGRHPLSQWEDTSIYLLLAATFLALSLLMVRRWRA